MISNGPALPTFHGRGQPRPESDSSLREEPARCPSCLLPSPARSHMADCAPLVLQIGADNPRSPEALCN